MGDIGMHFPPGKPEYKNVSSLKLLAEIKGKMTANGWQINNIDATYIAEKPHLREYIDIMPGTTAANTRHPDRTS